MFAAVLHGFVLALGLILPLGAQNLFVFNQGMLNRNIRNTLLVCATAAVCDTILIAAAVLGVSVLVLQLAWFKALLIGGGVLFLSYVGWVTWRSRPSNDAASFTGTRYQLIGYAAMLSLLNPHAILDTIGVIGTSSLSYDGLAKLTFGVTCVTVSWFWFFGLGLAGRFIGTRIRSDRVLMYLNKGSALIMWGAALYLIVANS